MAKKVSVEVDGVNPGEAEKIKPFDIYCPLMSNSQNYQRLNYWETNCRMRNKKPELHATCYPHCKMNKNKLVVGHIPKIGDVLQLGKKWNEMHKEGMTQANIGKQDNVSPATVSRYISMFLNSEGVKNKQYFYTINSQNAKEWFRLRYEEKQTMKNIAKTYAVSVTTVRKYINEQIRQKRIREKFNKHLSKEKKK